MNFHNLLSKIDQYDKPITQLKEVKSNAPLKELDLKSIKTLSGLNESCGMPPMMSSMPSSPPVTMNVSVNASGTENIRDLLDLLKGGDMMGDKDDAVSGPVGAVLSIDREEQGEQNPLDALTNSSQVEEGFGSIEAEVVKIMKQFDQDMLEIGGYGDPDIEGIALMLRQGDVEGALDEVYGSYSDQDGGELRNMDRYMESLEDEFKELASGGDDAEMEQYANSPEEAYAGDEVTKMKGNDLHSHGGNEAPKVNGGGNPYTVTSESLKSQLHNLYQEVRNR